MFLFVNKVIQVIMNCPKLNICFIYVHFICLALVGQMVVVAVKLGQLEVCPLVVHITPDCFKFFLTLVQTQLLLSRLNLGSGKAKHV